VFYEFRTTCPHWQRSKDAFCRPGSAGTESGWQSVSSIFCYRGRSANCLHHRGQ